MAIEKRRYPRYYFTGETLPRLTLSANGHGEIAADLLNISASGVCLSIAQLREFDPRRLQELRVKKLALTNGPLLENATLQLCYFYQAEALDKIVCGLKFRDLPESHRQKIQEYIQENADETEQIEL